jgi:hypothetical protein
LRIRLMKKVVSASRRTDLVAFFPDWLSSVLEEEEAKVHGPSGHTYTVNLGPDVVHSIVLWSKNFRNVIENFHRLRDNLQKYDQIYLHFTITGLGETFIERDVPPYRAALEQLPDLVKIVGTPERITIRFDPVVYWKERDSVCTNLHIFEKMASSLQKYGIKDIRISFAQWYRKAVKRAEKNGFRYIDPSEEEKLKGARYLIDVVQAWGFDLYSCSQNFLTEVLGIRPSSCIDGRLLQRLHPGKEPVSLAKDRSQRIECGCTESIDIGSYTQFCPHCCLYCYANPKT